VVSLPVLMALGVRENGEKVLLSLMTTGAESADGWQLLLDDLTVRKMGRPRLGMSDGNASLAAALDRRWPGLPQHYSRPSQFRRRRRITCTIALADWEGAATLLAVTVIVVSVDTTGAVNKPASEMVPIVAVQVTA
jgi:hypothetical protein